MDDDIFLLMSGESGGCHRCDTHYGLEVSTHQTVEEIVNIFHDMIEGNISNNYPIALYLVDRYDGEIVEDLKLGYDAGCIGGLYEISFDYNNMRYKVKRGNRKNVEKNG